MTANINPGNALVVLIFDLLACTKIRCSFGRQCRPHINMDQVRDKNLNRGGEWNGIVTAWNYRIRRRKKITATFY
jgi:hypothetical protein